MKPQTTRLILVASAFLAGLLLFSSIFLIVAGRSPVPLPASVSAIGGPFQLTDHDGKTITDQDLKGKPFLVFFGFTHCPDVCPTALFEVSEIMRALGLDADRVAGLFVTVDPERDTAPVMKDYLSSFDPHLRGVTGSPEAITAMERNYRVYSKKVPLEGKDYTMDHTALIYLMDKEGRFVAPFNMKRKPEEAAADLRRYF